MNRDFQPLKLPISLRKWIAEQNKHREALEVMSRQEGTAGLRPGNVVTQTSSGQHVGSSIYIPYFARIVASGPTFAAQLVHDISNDPDLGLIMVRYLDGPTPPRHVPFYAYLATETVLVTEMFIVEGAGGLVAWRLSRGRLGTTPKQHDSGDLIEANIPYAFQEVCQDTKGDFRDHHDGRHSDPLQPDEVLSQMSEDAFIMSTSEILIPAYEVSGIRVPTDGSAVVQLWLGYDSQTYYLFSYPTWDTESETKNKICAVMTAPTALKVCFVDNQEKSRYWYAEFENKPKFEVYKIGEDPRVQSISKDDFAANKDNYPLWPHKLLQANVTSACELTGIGPPSGSSSMDDVPDGTMIEIMNVGTEDLTLPHESSDSDEDKQISTSDEADITVRPRDTVALKRNKEAEKWYRLFFTKSTTVTKFVSDNNNGVNRNDSEYYPIPWVSTVSGTVDWDSGSPTDIVIKSNGMYLFYGTYRAPSAVDKFIFSAIRMYVNDLPVSSSIDVLPPLHDSPIDVEIALIAQNFFIRRSLLKDDVVVLKFVYFNSVNGVGDPPGAETYTTGSTWVMTVIGPYYDGFPSIGV